MPTDEADRAILGNLPSMQVAWPGDQSYNFCKWHYLNTGPHSFQYWFQQELKVFPPDIAQMLYD